MSSAVYTVTDATQGSYKKVKHGTQERTIVRTHKVAHILRWFLLSLSKENAPAV